MHKMIPVQDAIFLVHFLSFMNPKNYHFTDRYVVTSTGAPELHSDDAMDYEVIPSVDVATPTNNVANPLGDKVYLTNYEVVERDYDPMKDELDLTNCSCGVTTNRKTRIIHGAESLPKEFPFMVAIIYTVSREPFCGGAILTPRHAITAAHCTKVAKNRLIGVLAGAHDLRETTEAMQEILVSGVIEHESYEEVYEQPRNDIAVLVLTEKLQFNEAVSPVCMPLSKLNLDNTSITIVGWGRTDPNHKEKSPVLKKIDVTVRSSDECSLTYGSLFYSEYKHTIFCSGGGGSSPCLGDSGSPALYKDPDIDRYILVGLQSFGVEKCDEHIPSVQTDVAAFIPWIQAKIEGTLCYKT